MGRVLFAGIRVHDLAAARGWYEQLLGEPDSKSASAASPKGV
jgi:hypothetical protein